ncbi:MAG: NAD(P)/FAD-dependent oxidoreductase [Oscillatoriales cyanobacterium C42_A2020_001]|nr:NAD(P)/FAD-dependent oxidoreductase [Leptolyngbyaceae cyanobacterium C42_A2020_001]
MQKRPRVVVVGAGFGGMQAAQSLANSGAEVLLIDRYNYNSFIPLLYQVAFAQLEPGLIAYPVRTLFRNTPNVRFLMANVQQLNVTQKFIETERDVIPFDYLVLATGSQSRVAGVPGADRTAFPLRSLTDAIALRNQVLQCLEKASHEPDSAKRQQLLTFVIVGGGATGVEVAGALVELLRSLGRRDYRMLRREKAQIVMLQAGDRLLPDLPPTLGAYTGKKLRHIGVDVHLGVKVSQVTPEAVYLQNGQSICTETVVWTAGLEAAVPQSREAVETTTRGKLVTLPTLQLPNFPEIYAIGDVAQVAEADLTGVAPEALQQGVAVARNIKLQLKGRSPKPFTYFNKGRLAIIGCYSGVGYIAGIPLKGFLPWFMWLAVHLVYLPGFRNRLLVFLSWLQAFVLGDRAARAILPSTSQVLSNAASVAQKSAFQQ